MSQLKELPFSTLQFYATAPYPSYLPGRQARSQLAAPGHLINAGTYSQLVEQGFRRSGLFTYRPHCDNCQACVPVRVDAAAFAPNRSQRRAWRDHQPLQSFVAELAWSPEHYRLYTRYQQGRHPGGGMDEDSRTQYAQFLLTSRVNTRLVEFQRSGGRAGDGVHHRRAGRWPVLGLHLLRSGRARQPRHLQHPLADRAMPHAQPALAVPRLLDRRKPQDVLQGQLPPRTVPGGRQWRDGPPAPTA